MLFDLQCLHEREKKIIEMSEKDWESISARLINTQTLKSSKHTRQIKARFNACLPNQFFITIQSMVSNGRNVVVGVEELNYFLIDIVSLSLEEIRYAHTVLPYKRTILIASNVDTGLFVN